MKVETEIHCGVEYPKDPYRFGKTIEFNQNEKYYCDTVTVLFNKGKYFETSIPNTEVLKSVSELIEIPIQFSNMIVGSWKKLEDFVIAMNCFNVYVKINIDWV